uniref:Melanoma antigen preferentially expressed in tumors-like n=1 Tax=Moschus moschiferus TaxID=68415 RepID=A0A8C6CVU5_MOSMO
MSVWNPPRLLNLAGKSLLTDETLSISSLEHLPIELFPPLFMEAFCGRRRKTLKALVQAWPFVRLPLGGLMQTPHLETLQAVLDGLDVLLTQKDQPRRCKLHVLDLRNTGQDFWRMWSVSSVHVSSSSSMAPGAKDRSSTEQPLAPFEVFIELHLKERSMDGFLTYLMKWVQQRKASIHLCCKKLRILSFSMDNIMKVLSMVQLDCIQELHVNCTWHLSTLATFAPLLGQMSNLQRLLISHIHMSDPEEQEEEHVVKITSQFLRLPNLGLGRSLVSQLAINFHLSFQYLIPLFLSRCLMTPLDNLEITHCLLTDSDLTHLSQSPNISQLRSLDLSGVTMTYSSSELLSALLEKIASTLQELYLEQCGIRDSHLEAILPALSHCIQLMCFSLCGNLLSLAIMEKLLQHTSGLPRLSQELYPVPQESFSSDGILQPGRLLRAQLLEILRDLGKPRIIWIGLCPCPRCGEDVCPHMEPIIYSGPAPA